MQPFSRVCVSRCWLAGELACWLVDMFPDAFKRVSGAYGTFTLNKFECSKQAHVPEKSCME